LAAFGRSPTNNFKKSQPAAVGQLEGGVWHLLVGDKAASLSAALEALVSRTEVSAKV
jgi:hypothetical protein